MAAEAVAAMAYGASLLKLLDQDIGLYWNWEERKPKDDAKYNAYGTCFTDQNQAFSRCTAGTTSFLVASIILSSTT